MADKINPDRYFRVGGSIRSHSFASFAGTLHPRYQGAHFFEASLIQNARDAEGGNYEVWDETPESIRQNQVTRGYRAAFDHLLVDLKIERTPAAISAD